MSAEERLQTIRAQVQRCRACPLAAGRTRAVPGEGPAGSAVMFIGEGPGYHEDQQGQPFVGQAGRFLDELLGCAGLSRAEVFITNVVKCRPPNNRDPEPDELKACDEYLNAQIEAINPRVIVTLGRFSMGKFIEGGRISQIHGRPHKLDGRVVVTMYHPAAALHQPALKTTLLEDFGRLKQLLQQTETPPDLLSTPAAHKEAPPEQLSLF
ncbi:MAG TPA: uracil-DNA glycosylase [Anaerolineaceae bacterium]|jgi:DNA polymerase|nr:uracil-DNA glycosylase [Anaerolineaceae bacterium]HPS32695.1 uracil-DNA glycosylase [Anaerolineaceae bacterium]